MDFLGFGEITQRKVPREIMESVGEESQTVANGEYMLATHDFLAFIIHKCSFFQIRNSQMQMRAFCRGSILARRATFLTLLHDEFFFYGLDEEILGKFRARQEAGRKKGESD